MDIIKIVGLGLITSILIVFIRSQKPEIALQLSIVFGILIFGLMIEKIGAALQVFRQLASYANVKTMYMDIILKIIGIAYIAEFGAHISRDAGEGAVAAKVEFAGKILIVVMAIPIIIAVLDSIVKLLP